MLTKGQCRELCRDHCALALVKVSAANVDVDDKLDRISASERFEARLDPAARQARYRLRPSRIASSIVTMACCCPSLSLQFFECK